MTAIDSQSTRRLNGRLHRSWFQEFSLFTTVRRHLNVIAYINPHLRFPQARSRFAIVAHRRHCNAARRVSNSNHISDSKAPSTPATLSKQQSTLLPKTATMSNEFIVKYRPFDKVECCLDIVAAFRNNVAGFDS